MSYEANLSKQRWISRVQGALLTNFQPHDEQGKVMQALFGALINKDHEQAKRLFIRCGRKFGKTTISMACCWFYGLLFLRSRVYYLAPLQTQARELVWNNKALQTFMDDPLRGIYQTGQFIKRVDETDARIELVTGSFIKVDGSDNFDKQRGWNPNFVVADEYANFKKEWESVMFPNLIANDAPIVLMGTPPVLRSPEEAKHHHYVQRDKEFKRKMEAGDKRYFHLHAPSHCNPKPEVQLNLREEKERLYELGEPEVWEREYEAKIVYGGKGSVFPMFSRETHMFPHENLMSQVYHDRHRLKWFVVTDPGSRVCWAWMFGCYNPNTTDIYYLDEIYETDDARTATGILWPEAERKMQELYPSLPNAEWLKRYDDAALWFANEVRNDYKVHFVPAGKGQIKAEQGELKPGLSLIKTQLLHKRSHFSNRCQNLALELETYAKDDKGNIPKDSDHLIDCLRYTNHVLNARTSVNKTQVRVIDVTPYTDVRTLTIPATEEDEGYDLGDYGEYGYY